MNYWLVKSEPDVYSYERLEREGTTRWDGVRNYMARNNLRSMKTGDLCLYYHSNIGLEIVGIACVSREYYPDPTAESGDWSAVDLVPLKNSTGMLLWPRLKLIRPCSSCCWSEIRAYR